MSKFQQFSNDPHSLEDSGESKALFARERTLGHFLVIAVILSVIYLWSQ